MKIIKRPFSSWRLPGSKLLNYRPSPLLLILMTTYVFTLVDNFFFCHNAAQKMINKLVVAPAMNIVNLLYEWASLYNIFFFIVYLRFQVHWRSVWYLPLTWVIIYCQAMNLKFLRGCLGPSSVPCKLRAICDNVCYVVRVHYVCKNVFQFSAECWCDRLRGTYWAGNVSKCKS